MAVAMTGCSTLESDSKYDDYADKHSAYQLIERDAFEPINLRVLIMPEAEANKTTPASPKEEGQLIDQAFYQFANLHRHSGQLGTSRRNEIQERILAASDQRCNDFKNLLRKKFSKVNFYSGLTATGASLAATIVGNLHTSQILSGVAGMASGYRAEYNQAFFANAAVEVVAAGIDSRRRTAYEQILQARKDPLTVYPLEAAVKDGIRYHGLCSAVSGLQEAGEAVKYYNEPGIAAATRTLARSKMMDDIMQAKPEDVPAKIEKWQSALPVERYLAGNPLNNKVAPYVPEALEILDRYEGNLSYIKTSAADLASAVKKVTPASVPAALADKANKVAGSVQAAVAICKPAFLEKSKTILDYSAQQKNAKGDDAERLALQLKQESQSAMILASTVEFLASNYSTRASRVETAISNLGSPVNPAKVPELNAALADLVAYAPTVTAPCTLAK
ncbi:hypothetical protein ASC94_02160 [Massilia sp. Root418]|nr:hypothetical protein ASC94_02160 [Massilia sp. Root418]